MSVIHGAGGPGQCAADAAIRSADKTLKNRR